MAWSAITVDYERIKGLEPEEFKDDVGQFLPKPAVVTPERDATAKETVVDELSRHLTSHIVAYGGETTFFDSVSEAADAQPEIGRMLAFAFLYHWFFGSFAMSGNRDHQKAMHYHEKLLAKASSTADLLSVLVQPAKPATVRTVGSIVIHNVSSYGDA